mgnify:CR=1 FL=1
MKVIKVFPRRTKATPDDPETRIGCLPTFFDEADEVHISVAFTWDIPKAEKLAKQWEEVSRVRIGGPALGRPGGEFIPGVYLRPGYVITSRGCDNRCWFCSVWKREGSIRELEIEDGWNILDDNLLSCSEKHIVSVFGMLKRQNHQAEFTGGLEAKKLKAWHVSLLADLKPKQMFFAYDTPDDLEPLICAGKMLHEAGFSSTKSHAMRAYVLCGYPNDSYDYAETRMIQTIKAGFFPMAMLYRDEGGKYDFEWRRWQRTWARPQIVAAKVKEVACQV